MRTRYPRLPLLMIFGLVLAGAIVFGSAPEAEAQQFRLTWLDVGSYHEQYQSSGGRGAGTIGFAGQRWPGILTVGSGRASDHINSFGHYVGVKDWTGPDGTQHDFFVTRNGPRGPGKEFAFPVKHELVSSLGNPDSPKESQPSVLVDGAETFDNVSIVERVEPDMEADRMLHTVVNLAHGITMDRKVYQFSQEYHDQYHIVEYTYTNTGNTDGDEEIELPDQTLNGVLLSRFHSVTPNRQAAWVTGGENAWGKYNMVDVVGDGHADYSVDFRAFYVWAGWDPGFTKYNSLGSSIWDGAWYVAEGDTLGRLAGGSGPGRAILYGEKPGNEGSYDIDEDFPPPREMDADDLSSTDPNERQPWIMGWQDNDGRMATTGEPHADYYRIGMQSDGPKQGRVPHYADIVEPDGNFATTTSDASQGKQGGHYPVTTFGPYTLEPGESVRIVDVKSAAGLSWEARVKVGREYKQSGGDDSLHIAFDANGDGEIQGTSNDVDGAGNHGALPYDESLTKNRWVLTFRDSLNKQFERGRQAYWSEFQIPEPPLPPKELRVTGLPDRVRLEWDRYAASSSGGDHPEPIRWEIYRTSTRVDSLRYDKVAEVPAAQTSYKDTDLQRGIDYFYYVQAVGPELGQPGPAGTPGGVHLRSGRYYTQTYNPVQLKRPPGEALSDFEVVPNPFNLGSNPSIRWPDQENKLGFLDIPGRCRIKIFTESGELVKTIEHTDGSGDEFWRMTTDFRQVVSTGIYVAVVTDLETGQQETRKFTIIR